MIPETIERIKNSERAVSPVIGVILMVAITVILAAVIAAFVLGFGADQDSAPQATWSVENTTDSITFTHEGGDAVETDNLRLGGLTDNQTVVSTDGPDILRAGDSITFDLENEQEFDEDQVIRLVWEVGDDSSTLRTYTLRG